MFSCVTFSPSPRAKLERHRVLVRLELLEDLPIIVWGERVPLQQVFLNLVMNAVEAMSSLAYRKPLLSVKTQISELRNALITVTDCGTGIDRKDIDRIFDAFFTTKAEGMGMGLSICRSIVEGHGGRLWATPSVTQGSVFHVELPIGGRAA